jgi:hypothetical protein
MGKEGGQAVEKGLLTAIVRGSLGNEMTGQRVHLWRWLMLDLEVRLDCQSRTGGLCPEGLWDGWRVRLLGLGLTPSL